MRILKTLGVLAVFYGLGLISSCVSIWEMEPKEIHNRVILKGEKYHTFDSIPNESDLILNKTRGNDSEMVTLLTYLNTMSDEVRLAEERRLIFCLASFHVEFGISSSLGNTLNVRKRDLDTARLIVNKLSNDGLMKNLQITIRDQ